MLSNCVLKTEPSEWSWSQLWAVLISVTSGMKFQTCLFVHTFKFWNVKQTSWWILQNFGHFMFTWHFFSREGAVGKPCDLQKFLVNPPKRCFSQPPDQSPGLPWAAYCQGWNKQDFTPDTNVWWKNSESRMCKWSRYSHWCQMEQWCFLFNLKE